MSARWHFGIVEDGKTILSSIGKNAESCWQEIPRHFSHVTVGEYVIMPDHIHGILKISVDSSDSIPPQIRDPEVTGIPTDHQNENETSLQKKLKKVFDFAKVRFDFNNHSFFQISCNQVVSFKQLYRICVAISFS